MLIILHSKCYDMFLGNFGYYVVSLYSILMIIFSKILVNKYKFYYVKKVFSVENGKYTGKLV